MDAGVNVNNEKKLVRIWMKWTSHMERIEYDQQIQQMPRECRGKEGWRPRLRWENCVRSDLERMGDAWKTTSKERRNWTMLIEKVLQEKRREKSRKIKTEIVELNNGDADP